jgi:hypothetical protein
MKEMIARNATNPNASLAVEVEVLSREQLQQHSDCDMLRWVWKKDHRTKRPRCLGCNANWFEMFVVVKPWRKQANQWTLIGVCKNCSERADLYTIIRRKVLEQFPKGGVIDYGKFQEAEMEF